MVASPGFSCSSRAEPAVRAITVCRSTCSCPPNTVSALRPLDAALARLACSRAMASKENFCMRPSFPAAASAGQPNRRPAGPAALAAANRHVSSALAAEERKEVAGQGVGVGGCAVDVGGGPGAEHRHAEEVEPGGAGDHAAVVADAPRAVMHR